MTALPSTMSTARIPSSSAFVVAFAAFSLLFAASIVTVLLCYRLVPRKREVLFATTQGEVPAQ